MEEEDANPCPSILTHSQSRIFRDIFFSLPNAPVPDSTDVIVIGGGSIGCSTLYHLAKDGIKNCVLLERDKLTSGTTWHAAGLYWSLLPSDIDIELLANSKKLFTEILSKEADMEVGWIKNGGLFIASTKERLDEYKRLYSLAPVFGIEAHLLDPHQTNHLYPLMKTDDVYGSLYSPGDGIIDPSSWCLALTRAARKYGARVIEDCPVQQILTKSDDMGVQRVYGVMTSSGHLIKSPLVINCAGAWTPKLLAPLGITLPTMAIHHAYVTTDRIGDHVRHLPNIRDHDSALYVRTTGDALAFGGYESNAQFWDPVQDDFVFGLFQMDWDTFSIHTKKAYNRIPILESTGIKSSICGPISFTPDNKPLMGEIANVRGLFVACGMELGIMMGGALGQQMAKWAINGRPTIHLHSYDINRFNPKVTADSTWVKEKLHEGVHTMYHIHWPRDEPLAGRNRIHSPFHDSLSSLGCVFQERHGWERPGWFLTTSDDVPKCPVPPYDYYGAYGPSRQEKTLYEMCLAKEYTWQFPQHHHLIGQECTSVRKTAGILDMSSYGKFVIEGPDASKAISYLFPTTITSKSIGTTIPTCLLNDDGGIESDLIVSILSPSSYLIQLSSPHQTHLWSKINNILNDKLLNVQFINQTDHFGHLSIQGPQSGKILQKLGLTPDSMPDWSHKLVKIVGHECRLFRHSFLGELGFHLSIPLNGCSSIYEALHKAGNEFGLRDIGFRAYESLLAESGYPLWNMDIRSTDHPFQVGMDFMCNKIFKKDDFHGRQALIKLKGEALKKKLVRFVLDCEIPLWGLEAIYRNNHPISFVRRAEYGHTIRKSIAFGLLHRPDGLVISDDWIMSGQYQIEALGERYPAKVCLKKLSKQ